MDGFWRKHWYKTAMAVVTVILLVAIGYVYFGDKESSFPVQGPAAPFTLTDAQGQSVSLEKTEGVKMLYFFFANCPDICPSTTHMLSLVQDRLKEAGVFGTGASILQVTVDPERDTPEALQKYAEGYNADVSGWHFLRGTVDETEKIAGDYGIFIQKDDATGNFIHSNTVILIDGQNQIRKYYNGDDLNEETIADDVIRLVKEKS